MRIIAYESADAPPHLRWMAVFVAPVHVPKKGMRDDILPVRHVGPTEEGVRAAAQNFWDEESAKRAEPTKRKSKAVAAPIEDVDVI